MPAVAPLESYFARSTCRAWCDRSTTSSRLTNDVRSLTTPVDSVLRDQFEAMWMVPSRFPCGAHRGYDSRFRAVCLDSAGSAAAHVQTTARSWSSLASQVLLRAVTFSVCTSRKSWWLWLIAAKMRICVTQGANSLKRHGQRRHLHFFTPWRLSPARRSLPRPAWRALSPGTFCHRSFCGRLITDGLMVYIGKSAAENVSGLLHGRLNPC